jgi:hypothetical protein
MDYPTADPSSDTVKAQWLHSTDTDQVVHLHAQLSALVGSAQVIIDQHPAAVGESKRSDEYAALQTLPDLFR